MARIRRSNKHDKINKETLIGWGGVRVLRGGRYSERRSERCISFKCTLSLCIQSTFVISKSMDSLKYVEISVLQHIRFAELGEKLIRLTTFNKYMCNWTLEVRDILKRRNCSLGAISPLFHNIFLPIVRFSCLSRDKIFTSS